MKTLAILLSSLFITLVAPAIAQDQHPGDPASKATATQMQQCQDCEEHLLDKIQRETEDISVMKPFLFIASIIESRIELKKLEKESIAAAKSRESGNR